MDHKKQVYRVRHMARVEIARVRSTFTSDLVIDEGSRSEDDD